MASWRAAGLWGGLGRGKAQGGWQHSSTRLCKSSESSRQETTLTRSLKSLVSSQPASVRPEPLRAGQQHPHAAADVVQGGEPHRSLRGHTEAREALQGVRQEDAGQLHGEMCCCSPAVLSLQASVGTLPPMRCSSSWRTFKSLIYFVKYSPP